MKRLLLLAVLCLGGCRLSDPIYAFKPLTPQARTDDDVGLVVGTVKVDGRSGGLEGVVFRRVAPEPKDTYFYVTDQIYFREFRQRRVKDGTFTISLPPGAYEIDHLWTGGWPREVDWKLEDEAATSHRINVTRPGVYDLGTLAVSTSFFGPGSVEFKNDQADSERQDFVKALVRNSDWERAPMVAAH